LSKTFELLIEIRATKTLRQAQCDNRTGSTHVTILYIVILY